MEKTEEFTGLRMPVFMAFGWAGEETAQKYAYDQLELFAAELHAKVPQTLRDELPYFGLSEEVQSSYLAAAEEIEDDVFLLFNARPSSFEVQLGQRVAPIGMIVLQNGQSFVVTSAGASSLVSRILFTAFTIMKITNAIIMKLIMVMINAP